MYIHTYIQLGQSPIPTKNDIYIYIYIHVHTYIHTIGSVFIPTKNDIYIYMYIHTYIQLGQSLYLQKMIYV